MKPQEIAHGTAVRIYWYDSSALQGWQYSTQIGEVGRIVTLGYVVNTKPDVGITLTSSLATDSASIDPLTVPWGCIARLDTLPEEYSRAQGITSEMIEEESIAQRLAKGERGFPKIPDSPDTRHARKPKVPKS